MVTPGPSSVGSCSNGSGSQVTRCPDCLVSVVHAGGSGEGALRSMSPKCCSSRVLRLSELPALTLEGPDSD